MSHPTNPWLEATMSVSRACVHLVFSEFCLKPWRRTTSSWLEVTTSTLPAFLLSSGFVYERGVQQRILLQQVISKSLSSGHYLMDDDEKDGWRPPQVSYERVMSANRSSVQYTYNQKFDRRNQAHQDRVSFKSRYLERLPRVVGCRL